MTITNAIQTFLTNLDEAIGQADLFDGHPTTLVTFFQLRAVAREALVTLHNEQIRATEAIAALAIKV